LRAGAFAIDITPTNFPVIVNGMFEERYATNAHDLLHARALVLDDGREKIVIQVVDSCMVPREVLDQAKELASKATGIPTDHILISATHTHSAPSSMGCLGSRADTNYTRYLPGRLAEGIERAASRLAPAQAGWGRIDDYQHTFCRRWIRRPDRLLTDPFGQANVRANMHPGYLSPDAIGPSGPVDAGLSVLALRTAEGKPLALLANYSMHYFGSPLLSSDYYGLFADKIGKLIGVPEGDTSFVGIMSQGTSGDQACMDYSKPELKQTLEDFADGVARMAAEAYRGIEYHSSVPLGMRQTRITLGFRVPDDARLAWATEVVSKMKGTLPSGMAEIYAKEAIYLHGRPQAELILQAIRIGDLGLTAIPDEVFGITGLKLKARSPFASTFNIELANGSEGYIPPPEQHKLGGYTTWPARTAGLEPGAEPRIVEESLRLLEQLAGKPRRAATVSEGGFAKTVLDLRPAAFWRMNEFNGPDAGDSSGHHQTATYEDGVAFYLDGPSSKSFTGGETNRAPHFAGGRMRANLPGLRANYSVSLWFWNGLPNDARAVTGYLFSRGPDGDPQAAGDHLGIGGTHEGHEGRLIFYNGNKLETLLAGNTVIAPKSWNHAVLAREGDRVTVYLNGNEQPELSGTAAWSIPPDETRIFLGGRDDNFANFEGKLDEVAFFDRTLSGAEVAAVYQSSGMPAQPLAQAPPGLKLSSSALSPVDSMALMHVPEGYEIELVAAEPLVASPVAIDWGVDGRLWVVEMADYPMGMDGKMKPGGRVRVLEDTNGDGKFDKSTVFLDGLNFPNGIITWRDGILVTAAPDILFAADPGGKGMATKREVLYTGFREGNLQLRVNGLRWGLDNWLHCANGWSGGRPRSVKTGAEVELDGRDLRIRPDDGAIETESGQSEFGRNRDDWGDWFGCDNSYPLFHFVVEERYMRRNPYIPAPAAKVQTYLPANPMVYPVSRGQKRYHSFDQAGHFTSACSADFYRDNLVFNESGLMHALVCEPVHNLVQLLLVEEDGVTFKTRRAGGENDPEFLASEDQWFRPVMARMGPDGAIWVVDMYRYMIEHPDWLPPEGRKELAPFYREGENRGRIYRITKKGATRGTSKTLPRLDRMSPAELVATLESPNGWLRDKAQQMLVWKGDKSAVSAIEKLVVDGRVPATRLQALGTLDGLKSLSPTTLLRGLNDSDARVRRQSIRLAEAFPAGDSGIIAALERMVNDPDPKVRLQLACSLGEWSAPWAGKSLTELALRSGGDRYIAAAVMSSAVPHAEVLVNAVAAARDEAAEPLVEPLLSLCVSLGKRELAAKLLATMTEARDGSLTANQFMAFGHFLDLLARRGQPPNQVAAAADDSLAAQLKKVNVIFASARQIATDPRQVIAKKAAAVALLGREEAERAGDLARLATLLDPVIPGEMQIAAVRALAANGADGTSETLMKEWAAQGPETRSAILDALLAREKWTLDLLAQVVNQRIPALEIDARHRERMLKSRSENVRSLAASAFAAGSSSDRQKVIESYRPALGMPGDAARGKAVFARLCVACHQLDGVGREIGPNLISVKAHPPEKLLVSILDPSREVEPRYLAYECVLKGGEELYGLIASETGNGMVFKLADGTARDVLRGDIKSLRSARNSLMPDGLESGLSRQDAADLIRYLRYQPGAE